MACDYFLPRYASLPLPEDKIVPCLLPLNHGPDHLCLLADGEYILWQSDFLTCEHDPEEDCECFSYEYISKEAAEKLLAEGQS